MGAKAGIIEIDLQAGTARLNSDMVKATKILNSNVSQMKKSLDGLNATAKLVQVGIAAIIGSAVVQKAKEFVTAYAEVESSTVKLGSALKATGRYSVEALGQIKDSAHEVSLATATSGKSIIAASATFAQFAKSLNSKDIGRAQEAIVGYSKVMGVDLQKAAIQLGRVVAGSTDKIGRSGIVIKGAATEHERLNQVIGKTVSFYQQAKGEAGSLEGQIATLSIAHHHLEADLGEIIAKSTGSSSAIQLLTKGVEALDNWLKQNHGTITKTITFFLKMGETAVQIGGVVLNGIGAVVNAVAFGIVGTVKNALQMMQVLVNGASGLLSKIPGVGHIGQVPGLGGISQLQGQLFQNFTNNSKNSAQGMRDLMSGKSVFGSASSNGNFFAGLTGSASTGLTNSKAGSGGSKKVDPDIARAKSLIKEAEGPLEKYQAAIKEADRLLKKHLLSYAQWQEVIDKADIATNKMIKINPSMDELTKAQRDRVDPTRRVDFGFGTSGSVKEALDKQVGKPFEEFSKSLMESWNSDMNQIKIGDSIIDSVSTATEKYTKTIAELDRQLVANNITQQQYNLAKKDAEQLKPEASIQKEMSELKRLTEARTHGIKAYQNMQAAIIAENTLRENHLSLLTEEGKNLYGLVTNSEKYKNQVDKMRDAIQEFGQVGAQVGDIITNAFGNMIFNGAKFSDTLKQLALDMAKLVFQESVSRPIANALGGLFSNIGAGLASHFLHFADGGNPPVGVPSLVGERGPELFVPRTAGTVIPNGQFGGGSVHITNVFNISTGVQQTVRSEFTAMMPMVEKRTTAAVMTAIGRGGKMAGAVGRKA